MPVASDPTTRPPEPDVSGDVSVDPRVERSRQKVLTAARQILLADGLAAITVEAVVQQSGVARATVYRHWESREALVRATVHTFLPSVVPPAPDMPFEQRLRTVMRNVAGVVLDAEWRRFFPILIESVNRVDGLEGTRERVASLQRSVLVQVIEGGITEGALPPDTNVAESVLMLLGPLVLASLDTTLPIDDTIADTLVTRLLASA